MARQYVVLGCKWFDKVNGNTYHNAKIVDMFSGETFYSGFHYGYDNAYMESAREAIRDRELDIYLYHNNDDNAAAGYGDNNYTIINIGSFYATKTECKKGQF